MRRLVYTPRVYAFIKDSRGQIHDVSRYVTSGSVNRRIDAVSSAEITLRNPNKIFTTPKPDGSPYFSPMDPITIFLKRAPGRPVRVFTGFLDKTVYLQLFPGTISLRASCTLKRLLYTFFDPALPYTLSFLSAYGWYPVDGDLSQWVSPNAYNDFRREMEVDGKLFENNTGATLPAEGDGSIGQLLFATLKHIGFWDEKQIYIESLPQDLFTRLTNLAQQFDDANDEAREEFNSMMRSIIGSSDYGGAFITDEEVAAAGAEYDVESLAALWIEAGGDPAVARVAAAVAMAESGGIPTKDSPPNSDGSIDRGLWQINNRWHPDVSDEEAHNPLECAKAAIRISSNGTNWQPWTTYRNGAYRKFLNVVQNRDHADTGPSDDRASQPGPGRTGATVLDKEIDKTGKNVSNVIHRPIDGDVTFGRGWHESSVGVTGQTNTSGRGVHWHSGIDIRVALGTPCKAPADGKITMAGVPFAGGSMVHFEFTRDVGDIKAGTVIGWGHVTDTKVKVGDSVERGQVLAYSGDPGGGPHVHFVQKNGEDGRPDGDVDPGPLARALMKGETSPTSSGGPSGASGGAGMGSEGAAGALFGAIEMPGVFELYEATRLQGDKSLMNDKPLMPFVQQLCEASLRHFQSTPDGKFFAFYPDYFGEMYHHNPYWIIDDIEILDGKIELSDDALVTHMYVVGDTMNPLGTSPSQLRSAFSRGVVTIFNAFMADSVINRSSSYAKDEKSKKKNNQRDTTPPKGMDILLKKDEAIAFLERYGARPMREDMPMIRHPAFEMMLAYQRFLLNWSKQFLTTFTFTFMPELFPGGKVGFSGHGLQMYIDEVTHTWDYTSGFTTQANLSAPSAMGKGSNLPPNMVRAIITDNESIAPTPNTGKGRSGQPGLGRTGQDR